MTEKLPEWDLSDLYPSMDCKELVEDFQTLNASIAKFEHRYRGKLSSLSPDQFGASIEEYEKIENVSGKIGSYAHLLKATQLDNKDVSKFYQTIVEKLTDAGNKTTFYALELNALSEEQMAEKLTSPATAHYKPFLDEVRAYKPYQISEELERLSSDKSLTGKSAWVQLYEQTMSKLRFNIGGKEMTVSEATNVISFAPSQEERRAAGEEFDRVMKQNGDTFAFITNTLAKDKEINDKWHNMPSMLTARNLSNQVEDEVVNSLVSSVKDSYGDISHRFYKMKADWLGVDKLEYWDRNAPIPGIEPKKYTWEEAKKIVLSAYREFSPELAGVAENFVKNDWIDVGPKPGKRSGAFASSTVTTAHPYLLLNFMGSASDVKTFAHELGHGVHQMQSRKQGDLMAGTPLTIAETASVFGEMITFQHMMKNEKDPKQRFAMLAEKTGAMMNTVVRQIAFHEFESAVHTERREKGELSAERMNELYTKTQSEALGPSVVNDDRSSSSWMSIPHLVRTPFYVHAYAFGDCLVNSLYKVHEEGKVDGFKEKYMDMLSKGGSEKHKELLAPFGLDASKPDFWKKGLSVVKGFVDELEKLTDELGMNKNKVQETPAKQTPAAAKKPQKGR